MGKSDDINLSARETKQVARGTGWVSIVLAVLCLMIGIATWRPLVEIYQQRDPWGITLVELALWFAIAAWLCFVPPYNGILLVVGGIGAAILLGNANSLARDHQAAWPVAVGALVFSAGGLLMMVVAKISGQEHFRRPYWQEAWPGVVLVVLGGIAALVLSVALPEPPVWLPPGVVPAEAG